ncbi:MAG: DNA-directed RNA polymerase subunit omega [Bacilli bacterium]|nr:DNA-directed RNA polymerase subunit omega [Bacilli bacterium]
MRNSKDGMRYPSIDQLIEVTKSKYKLVVGAAKRAREIEHGASILITNPHNKRSIGIALEEIIEGKVIITDAVEQVEELAPKN